MSVWNELGDDRWSQLRSYLKTSLQDCKVSSSTEDGGANPLLILEARSVVAAFAMSEAPALESYDRLYKSFKRQFASHEDEWTNKDIAFVFMVSADLPGLQDFCSKVETDTYFCRKFVLPVKESLSRQLASLPFLPLAPVDEPALRPPAAQTLLQAAGVSAVLAKQLVVQRERSPEGIIQDCLEQRYGSIGKLDTPKTVSTALPSTSHDSVRLASVTIERFRAYKKPQTFVLGSAITVLYGSNGFGKTSFFDAVDFAVTGGIGRLRKMDQSEPQFRKAAQHLDAPNEAGAVTLRLITPMGERQLYRQVDDRKRAAWDGELLERKQILKELTGGQVPGAERVESFVDLFRATHLFSQEHQELTKDFKEDCEISNDTVSRMLAFEDYVTALDKVSNVQDLLRASINAAEDRQHAFQAQIVQGEKELERLGVVSAFQGSTAGADDELKTIAPLLGKYGVQIPTIADLSSIRNLRAAVIVRPAPSCGVEQAA